MSDWNILVTERYERTYKEYEKKHPHELMAVLANLQAYSSALQKLGHPLQIKAGYIHGETRGVIALDQKGGKQKVKLQQTRLYAYPDCEAKVLYLLIIGDKGSQKRDIAYCEEFVGQIRR